MKVRGSSHVLRRRAVLQLGASLGSGGTIPRDRAAAAVAAAKRLRSQLDASGSATSVVAVGTAALREASNGPQLVKRLERAIGMPVRVLDGRRRSQAVSRRTEGERLDRVRARCSGSTWVAEASRLR